MRKYINISDVLWFQEGPGVRNTQYTTDGVKLLNVANLINGNVDTTNTNRYISKEEAYGKYKHFLADEGDLVIASSGIKVEYFDKKMGLIRREQLPLCMNTSTIRFKVTDQKRLSIRYFMYYLKSAHFKEQLSQQITGSAQLNFGPSHLKKMVFPLIEMEEQAKIIDKLDTLHDIEYKMRTELKLYDQLTSSLFIEMFGDLVKGKYEIKKLKDISKKISDGIHSKPEYTKTGRPFLSVVNINKGKVNFEDCKYVSEESFQKMIKSTHPEKGDILYTKVGATYGIAAYIDTNVEFCLYVSVCLIKPKHYLINAKFLSIQMNMPFIKYQADNRIKGIGVPDLHLNQIREFDIIVPPLDLQNRFAEYVSLIDKSKLAVKKSLEELEILKKSLMQKYFA